MTRDEFRHWLVPALLLLGLIFRLAYGMRFPPFDAQGKIMDSDRYVALAGTFADSWGFLDENGVPTAHREPAYSAALGTAYKIFGKGYGPLLVLNTLMDLAALYLLLLAGSALFGETAALMALAVGVFYPPFIYYTSQPLRDTMMTFLGCLLIWTLIRAQEKSSAAGFAAAGLIAAAAALTKTTLLPYGLLIPPAIWIYNRTDLKRALRLSGAFFACFVLLYSTWVIRNCRQFHSLILGTNVAAGDHFYMFQIVPQSVGGTPEHYAILDKDPVWIEGQKLDEVAKDKFFWKAGIRLIKETPIRYTRLVAWRFFWDMWRFYPRPRTYSHSYAVLKWVSLLTDGWIIPLGFLGILIVGLSAPEAGWIYLFIGSVDFAYSLILTMLRYRLPMMPWLILFACVALERGWKKLASKN